MSIRVVTCTDAEAVAEAACREICAAAVAAVAARGQFVFAVSGGRTPGAMLRHLRHASMPWEATWIVQVDERVAPDGHPDRNLTAIHQNLVLEGGLPADHLLAMPVTDPDLPAAARRYAARLGELAPPPVQLDLLQLGLGEDGHTASLIPGDPMDESAEPTVAVASVYQGRQRLTLTLRTINDARQRLWVVTGLSKREALAQVLAGNRTIPAGHVSHENTVLITDLL